MKKEEGLIAGSVMCVKSAPQCGGDRRQSPQHDQCGPRTCKAETVGVRVNFVGLARNSSIRIVQSNMMSMMCMMQCNGSNTCSGDNHACFASARHLLSQGHATCSATMSADARSFARSSKDRPSSTKPAMRHVCVHAHE
jgi:hypothetical protein